MEHTAQALDKVDNDLKLLEAKEIEFDNLKRNVDLNSTTPYIMDWSETMILRQAKKLREFRELLSLRFELLLIRKWLVQRAKDDPIGSAFVELGRLLQDVDGCLALRCEEGMFE